MLLELFNATKLLISIADFVSPACRRPSAYLWDVVRMVLYFSGRSLFSVCAPP